MLVEVGRKYSYREVETHNYKLDSGHVMLSASWIKERGSNRRLEKTAQ
jgi:hypothetical protein